jgi:predicted dinucleotide-binding enzyme
MRLRLEKDRWLSSVGFLLVLCCFALPFAGWVGIATNDRMAIYRGIDLVIGAPAKVVTVASSGGRTDRDEAAPRRLPAMTAVQPHAAAALALVVVGTALGAVPWRAVRALAAATTALAAVVLVAIVAYAPWRGPGRISA